MPPVQDITFFEKELSALIGKPSNLRPFVCEGSPLECKVFIIGFNPASASSVDFWNFWRPGYGFDKGRWYECYLTERRERPLKPGKTRRNSVSNSRRVIEWVLSEANPLKLLETNIHSLPTEEMSDLEASCRSTAPLDFLIRAIKPRLIVVHGKKAKDHIEAQCGQVSMIAVDHFSRGWSQESARDLGRRIVREHDNG